MATTINYIDWSVLSFTMPDENFRKELVRILSTQALTEADIAYSKPQTGLRHRIYLYRMAD